KKFEYPPEFYESPHRLIPELERLKPSEVIAAESAELPDLGLEASLTRLEDYWFETEVARQTILEHFGVATLEGYGCSHLPLAVSAAGAIIHYIQETQKGVLGQLTRLTTYSTSARTSSAASRGEVNPSQSWGVTVKSKNSDCAKTVLDCASPGRALPEFQYLPEHAKQSAR
ncbi:unnamed protein product, partial [marine sediment metagenome]